MPIPVRPDCRSAPGPGRSRACAGGARRAPPQPALQFPTSATGAARARHRRPPLRRRSRSTGAGLGNGAGARCGRLERSRRRDGRYGLPRDAAPGLLLTHLQQWIEVEPDYEPAEHQPKPDPDDGPPGKIGAVTQEDSASPELAYAAGIEFVHVLGAAGLEITAEEAEAHRRVVGVGSTRSVPGRTLLQVGCEEHQRTELVPWGPCRGNLEDAGAELRIAEEDD